VHLFAKESFYYQVRRARGLADHALPHPVSQSRLAFLHDLRRQRIDIYAVLRSINVKGSLICLGGLEGDSI
jgi:hypothetical protein